MLRTLSKLLVTTTLSLLALFSFAASWLAYEYAVIPTFSRVVVCVGCFVIAVLLVMLVTSELSQKVKLVHA